MGERDNFMIKCDSYKDQCPGCLSERTPPKYRELQTSYLYCDRCGKKYTIKIVTTPFNFNKTRTRKLYDRFVHQTP